jgi:hypothetical protein
MIGFHLEGLSWTELSQVSEDIFRQALLRKAAFYGWDRQHFHETANAMIRDANVSERPLKKQVLLRVAKVLRDLCAEPWIENSGALLESLVEQIRASIADLPAGHERNARCQEVIAHYLESATSEKEIVFWKNVLEKMTR